MICKRQRSYWTRCLLLYRKSSAAPLPQQPHTIHSMHAVLAPAEFRMKPLGVARAHKKQSTHQIKRQNSNTRRDTRGQKTYKTQPSRPPSCPQQPRRCHRLSQCVDARVEELNTRPSAVACVPKLQGTSAAPRHTALEGHL